MTWCVEWGESCQKLSYGLSSAGHHLLAPTSNPCSPCWTLPAADATSLLSPPPACLAACGSCVRKGSRQMMWQHARGLPALNLDQTQSGSERMRFTHWESSRVHSLLCSSWRSGPLAGVHHSLSSSWVTVGCGGRQASATYTPHLGISPPACSLSPHLYHAVASLLPQWPTSQLPLLGMSTDAPPLRFDPFWRELSLEWKGKGDGPGIAQSP